MLKTRKYDRMAEINQLEFVEELIVMEYMGDESYWNHKFSNRIEKLLPPEKLLLDDLETFQFGDSGLELACGDGRNIISLAKKGYAMTGVDFSEIAIERLKRFSKEQSVTVDVFQMDLSKRTFMENLPKFDFIIINHYRLCPDFYFELIKYLNKGGYLWVNGFSSLPKNNSDVTQKDLITNKDFEYIQNILLDKKEYEDGDRKFVRYCFRKQLS